MHCLPQNRRCDRSLLVKLVGGDRGRHLSREREKRKRKTVRGGSWEEKWESVDTGVRSTAMRGLVKMSRESGKCACSFSSVRERAGFNYRNPPSPCRTARPRCRPPSCSDDSGKRTRSLTRSRRYVRICMSRRRIGTCLAWISTKVDEYQDGKCAIRTACRSNSSAVCRRLGS